MITPFGYACLCLISFANTVVFFEYHLKLVREERPRWRIALSSAAIVSNILSGVVTGLTLIATPAGG